VIADKIVPIQKYQPHVVYSPVRPAKKIPTLILVSALIKGLDEFGSTYKNPSGAQAP
jgi:hypothetical protein